MKKYKLNTRGGNMEVFKYKMFSVGYREFLKNTFSFVMVTKDGKTVYNDYVICYDKNDVRAEIEKKLSSIFSKQRVGIFRVEINFVDKLWTPCVTIWLPSDEVICEELIISKKPIKDIITTVKKMLTEDVEEYNNFFIIDYLKYGKNINQKNLCAFRIDYTGKYVTVYADTRENLFEKLKRM